MTENDVVLLEEKSKPMAESLERVMRELKPTMSLTIMLLRLAGKDKKLRSKLLEFIDVMPSLGGNRKKIRNHFRMYMDEHRHRFPVPYKQMLNVMNIPVVSLWCAGVMEWVIKNKFAPHFIIKDKDELFELSSLYSADNCGVMADFLGEKVLTKKESEQFIRKYQEAMGWVDRGIVHVSVKPSSLYPFFEPEHYSLAKREAEVTLYGMFVSAFMQYNSRVTLDAEHYALRDLTEDVFCQVVSELKISGCDNFGIAVQAYLKDSMGSAERFVGVAKKRGAPLMVRLVKGAYWDTEVEIANQNGWSVPVFENKEETDRNFNRIALYLLENSDYIRFYPATHNPKSIAFVYTAMNELGLLNNNEFMNNFAYQVLYGLGESPRKALAQMHLPTLVYAPMGNLMEGMSYFARRILENTSNEGFLFTLVDE